MMIYFLAMNKIDLVFVLQAVDTDHSALTAITLQTILRIASLRKWLQPYIIRLKPKGVSGQVLGCVKPCEPPPAPQLAALLYQNHPFIKFGDFLGQNLTLIYNNNNL